MKITVLGAGQVGGTLAEYLSHEKNDITVVDNNKLSLPKLKDRCDLRVVLGHAAFPCVLSDAGVKESDMIIAVTSSDEVNMIACKISYSLFKVPRILARIRSYEYMKCSHKFFFKKMLCIDHLILSERFIIKDICNLLKYPGALQVINFFNNNVVLLVFKINKNQIFLGKTISELQLKFQHINLFVPIIFRQRHLSFPKLSTRLELDNQVVFLSFSNNVSSLINVFNQSIKPCKKIMIVGGGNIGFGLAKILENYYKIKLIELNPKRANILSKRLQNTIVFCGNASDHNLLLEEAIDQIDVFISVTDNDEVNIMSAILAKKLGANRNIVLMQRESYIDLIYNYNDIDVIISPKHSTISSVMSHVRNFNIKNCALLNNTEVEIFEIVITDNYFSSSIIGNKVKLIKFPSGSKIIGIIRDKQLISKVNNITLKVEDTLIFLIFDKSCLIEIEQLFSKNSY